MSQKGFDLTVSPTGKTRVEAVGYQGSSCLTATKQLHDALGGAGEVEATSAMHEQESQDDRLRNSQGNR